MPTGMSRSWAAAHRGSYMGLSYPFPSGGYTVTMPPASPILAQRSSSLTPSCTSSTLIMAMPLRRLGSPVQNSASQSLYPLKISDSSAVWHAVQQQTDRGIDNTYIHPIGIHILEVLLRDVAPAPDFIKGRGTDHLFRRLKPHASLCPRGQPDRPVAIAEPPVAIILPDQLRDAVL